MSWRVLTQVSRSKVNHASVMHLEVRLSKILALYRRCSTQARKISVERLEQRSLLRLRGNDTCSFLQGIVTNDVSSFEETNRSKYAVVLNTNGRVLCDCLIYKMEENQYFLECDKPAVGLLIKHLNFYKLRKAVEVQELQDMNVWVAYSNETDRLAHDDILSLKSASGVVFVAQDPRLHELGFRFITSATSALATQGTLDGSYTKYRYRLGVGEGVKDHPPSQCLPFETNLDILNGVSFSKGCYIGQEMTAKIHYTGVVRKRLMPVSLNSEQDSSEKFEAESLVVNDKGQRIGRLRSHLGKYGIAALNIEDAMKSNKLLLKGLNCTIVPTIPKWWPSATSKFSNQYV